MARAFSEIFGPEATTEQPTGLHSDLDRLAGRPFDRDFIKAVMAPNVQDWYEYALKGDRGPTISEILLPWTRTGRFHQADQMRTIFQHALAGEMVKSAHEQALLPPSLASAQAQVPTAFSLAGLGPDVSRIQQPPALPGQMGPAPLDYISPPAQEALMQQPLSPLQGHALLAALPHAPAAAIEQIKYEQALAMTKGPVPQLQQRRSYLESQLQRDPGNPTLEREIAEIQGAIDLATTSQKEGIQPNKVALSLFPGVKSYDALKSSLVTPDDEDRLTRLSAMTGVPIVAKVGMTKQEAVDATLFQRQIAIAGAQASAAAVGRQASTLVQPGVRSDLYERGPFFKTGELKNAPSGITETQAAKGGYIQLSDKQRADLAHTEQAGIQLDSIMGMADKLITATTGLQAWKQGGILTLGAVSRTNSTAKVYADSLDALSNSLSRSLGGERGVLTNQDVIRWVNAMPKFSDTVEIKDQKKKLIKRIYQTSVDAQRRALAGDDITSAKTELSRMLQRLTDIDTQATEQLIEHKLDKIVK